MQWPVTIDWECPSGRLLTELGNAISRDRLTPIILFGSAALQMTVAPRVLSADMDIAPDIIPYDARSTRFPHPMDRDELGQIVRQKRLGLGQRKLYVQVNAPGAFQPGTSYLRRVLETTRGGLVVTIPHPIDILVAKLHRYEEKDKIAFQEVYRRTGFPSETDLLVELRASHRLFARHDRSLEHMPGQFPASKITVNVPRLWKDLYGKTIHVKKDILAPVTQEIAASYADHDRGHTDKLAEIAKRPLGRAKIKGDKHG